MSFKKAFQLTRLIQSYLGIISLCFLLYTTFHLLQVILTDLKKKMNRWITQGKMNFNLDTTKQAREVIFSRKTKKRSHLPLLFNNVNVTQTSFQKYFEVLLDTQLKFDDHLKMVSVN